MRTLWRKQIGRFIFELTDLQLGATVGWERSYDFRPFYLGPLHIYAPAKPKEYRQ